jgi:hypothetical protein
LELFVSDGQRLTLWELISIVDPAFRQNEKWVRRDEWAVEMREPFSVHPTRTGYVLVTYSGQATAVERGRGGNSELTPVWRGEPIRAILTDEKTGKHYAFTDRFFFVLEPNPVPTDHRLEPTRFRLKWRAGWTLTECAGVIAGGKAS